MWFRKKRIYADAAAATPISPRARAELIRLLDMHGNAGALHKEGVVAKNELEESRKTIADAIGAHPDELVFTASGTEGNNLALQGILRPFLRSGTPVHAITSTIEHSSVLEPLRALTREGLRLTELSVDSEGFVSAKELAEAITDETVLISIQYINSEIGTVEPIRDIAKEIRRVRKARQPGQVPLYFHTDASQAPLWLDIKVESLGIDLLTLDAQKVLGPKGVGALYVKRGVQIEPLLLGSKQERGLRGGTENIPLIGAFAVAMQDAAHGVETRTKNISDVRDYLFEQIKKRIPEVLVNGPQLEKAFAASSDEAKAPSATSASASATAVYRSANNLNISIPGLDREMAVLGLDAEGIAITTRSACNVADSELSYVIVALGGGSEKAKSAIRITLLPDATKADADVIAETLEKIAKRYKTVV